MIVKKEKVIEDIKALGLELGDTIFVTADLMNVGFFEKNKKYTSEQWIEILKECVGEEGTIILASYTKTFFFLKKNPEIVFDRFSKTYAGDLPNILIKQPLAIRSKHPTFSCIGIGPNAAKILEKHDHNSTAYHPLGEIIKLNGKFLLLGCLDKKNAPQGMHYAQERLGHTKQGPMVGLMQSYFIDDNGEKKLFTKRDLGGCSRGGYKLYGELIVNHAIKFGYVGNGFSAIMDAKESCDVIYNALSKDRKIILCDDKTCIDCYGKWQNTGFGTVPFYFRKIFSILLKK
jgi:aminoglycoside 3-N-acetyltransferase